MIELLFRMVKGILFCNLVGKLDSDRRTNDLKRVKKLNIVLSLIRNSALVLTRVT